MAISTIGTNGIDQTNNLQIGATGNVGIGTAAGADKLTVATTTGAVYTAIKRASQSTGEVGISLYGGTSGINWALYQPGSGNDFRIWNNNLGNDVAKFDQAGNWWMNISGKSILNPAGRPMLNQTGGVLQTIYANSATQTTTTTSTYVNSTLTATITPSSTSSKILVIAGCSIGSNGAAYANLQLWRNGSNQFTFAQSVAYTGGSNGAYTGYPLTYLDSPASTSAQTYTVYFNNANSGTGNTRFNSDTSFSSITLMEIAQ